MEVCFQIRETNIDLAVQDRVVDTFPMLGDKWNADEIFRIESVGRWSKILEYLSDELIWQSGNEAFS